MTKKQKNQKENLLNYQTLIIGKTFQETDHAWPVIPVVF